MSWRAAHAWLRGYSDARAGKDTLGERNPFGPEYADAYTRGYFAGTGYDLSRAA